MIVSVHQPQYLPWLGYFAKIAQSDCFVFLDQVQYKVREFQNRNKIRTNSGEQWLTVPVLTKGEGRQRIDEVRIDNELPWRRQHLRSLEISYAKADFFNEYILYFRSLYEKDWDRLIDLNKEIVRFILQELGIQTPLKLESEIGTTAAKTERIIEICQKLKADTYLSGIGAKEYLAEEKFAQAGIKLIYQDFKHPVYCQQFMKDAADFLPYMSAVDLLMNEGEKSRRILEL